MITMDHLKKCHLQLVLHLNGGNVHTSQHQCVEHPRLGRISRSFKRERRTETEWYVDTMQVPDLQAALDLLNAGPSASPSEPAHE